MSGVQLVSQRKMPRKPSGNDVPVAVRLPKEWLDRVDTLKSFLEGGRAGLDLSKSDILRMVVARGLEALEGERDAAAKRGKR